MIIIEIAGHLGADPETRVTPSGQKVTTLRVATNVRQGDRDETVWWQVSIWGSDFDNMIKHLKKGSAVIVIGEMGKLEIYTDKEGKQQISYRMTARILKFSPFGKPDRGQGQDQQQAGSHAAHAAAGYSTSAGNYGTGGHAYSQDSAGEPPF